MRIKNTFLMMMISLLIGSAFSQMPVSREGTLVETISSAEVMVEATGIYFGEGRSDRSKRRDVGNNGVSEALKDARRAAIYTLLFGGTDPMLSQPQERSDFERRADRFLNEEALTNYITWEDPQFLTRVRIEEGTGIRVSKNFRINKEHLLRDLVAAGITVAREDIIAQVGFPIIMVIPDTEQGQDPIEKLSQDREARQAATVIQSYLTARGYDVVVPEQQAALSDLAAAQIMVEGQQRDFAYELALSIGSDVYITFSGSVDEAAYGTERYAMSINAFETTTARLLGSETGYSQGRRGETMVSLEEAVNTSIDNVLNRIMNYWRTDLGRGIQYKLIVSIDPHFDDFQVDEIHLAFMDAVDKMARSSRELILTSQTIDYLVWLDPAEYDRSLRVYRNLKQIFDGMMTDGELGRINMNRKMLLLRVDY